MLKEAIQYLVGLKDNKTYEIAGSTYSDRELSRIVPHVDRPSSITVNGLDSLVKLIRAEVQRVNCPIFIRVKDAREVSVFTTYDDTMTRNGLYCAACDVPDFRGGWRDHDQAVIELRSKFIETKDSCYLLDLLSRVSRDDSVTTADNGVSQEVTARTGISLKQKVAVKPRVSLQPYRTFLEVEQPESEFILRLDEQGRVGLMEADGGMWVMEAKRLIVDYFSSNLEPFIADGTVIVMM